ncbi:PEP-CTERM sorting domain-containing protein [Nitriliruptoraceae bacterium ZYF776]|nr:PEP-CTERM sorting domain-containing protein [Profundirhabdus halotolerans]
MATAADSPATPGRPLRQAHSVPNSASAVGPWGHNVSAATDHRAVPEPSTTVAMAAVGTGTSRRSNA